MIEFMWVSVEQVKSMACIIHIYIYMTYLVHCSEIPQRFLMAASSRRFSVTSLWMSRDGGKLIRPSNFMMILTMSMS